MSAGVSKQLLPSPHEKEKACNVGADGYEVRACVLGPGPRALPPLPPPP